MQFPLYHLLPGKLELKGLEFHLFVVVVESPNRINVAKLLVLPLNIDTAQLFPW